MNESLTEPVSESVSEPASEPASEHVAVERMLFFSDAVFAIAITLLALELKLPTEAPIVSQSELIDALGEVLPKFIAFIASFFLIGQTWIEHHRMGRFVEAYDRGLLWRNLLLLLFVSMIPFAAALIGDYARLPIATTIYSVCFLCVGLSKVWFWRHAVSKGFVHGDLREAAEINRRVWAAPLVSLGVAALSLLQLPYTYIGFCVTPLIAALLIRRLPQPH